MARDRMTPFLGDLHIRNPVVLSGDIHSSLAADPLFIVPSADVPLLDLASCQHIADPPGVRRSRI